MKKIIDLTPKKTRDISPTEYLSLDKQERRNIASCRFTPPKIGSKDFGHFNITLKRPIYTLINGEAE